MGLNKVQIKWNPIEENGLSLKSNLKEVKKALQNGPLLLEMS